MRQLLLLRHAKSAWDVPGQPDHARPLDAAGRVAAAGVRASLRRFGLLPDVVLVSSARRTLQTLEALGPWDVTPLIEPMDGLYLATPAQILRVVAGVSETVRSLMVVGHNPGLHELAVVLTGLPGVSSNGNIAAQVTEDFPTGALAEFTVAPSWREFAAANGEAGGRLVRFIRPRDLPEEAR